MNSTKRLWVKSQGQKREQKLLVHSAKLSCWKISSTAASAASHIRLVDIVEKSSDVLSLKQNFSMNTLYTFVIKFSIYKFSRFRVIIKDASTGL